MYKRYILNLNNRAIPGKVTLFSFFVLSFLAGLLGANYSYTISIVSFTSLFLLWLNIDVFSKYILLKGQCYD